MSDSKNVISRTAAAGTATGSSSHAARADSEPPAANPALRKSSTPRKSPKATEADTTAPVAGNVGASSNAMPSPSAKASSDATGTPRTTTEEAQPVSGTRPKNGKPRTAARKKDDASAEGPAAAVASAERQPGASPASALSPPDQTQLEKMVAEAAYYLAEKRNFEPGWEHEDWLSAKAAVMAELERGVV